MVTRESTHDLRNVLSRAKTLTFDCYGTLVDWKGGLSAAFVELFPDAARTRLDELFDTYVSVEAEVEGGPYRRYRDILRVVSDRLAARMGVELDAIQRGHLAEALPHWPLFPDTNEALTRLKRHYALGVLSNIDRDLFAGTRRSFTESFDFVITAEDVGSYKPAGGHFRRMLEEQGSVASTVHVAQSLFHDGVPANEWGIPFVWINRYGQPRERGVPVSAEFPDLLSLARLADEVGS